MLQDPVNTQIFSDSLHSPCHSHCLSSPLSLLRGCKPQGILWFLWCSAKKQGLTPRDVKWWRNLSELGPFISHLWCSDCLPSRNNNMFPSVCNTRLSQANHHFGGQSYYWTHDNMLPLNNRDNLTCHFMSRGEELDVKATLLFSPYICPAKPLSPGNFGTGLQPFDFRNLSGLHASTGLLS